MPRFLNLFPESPRPSTIVRHATKYSGSITVNSPVFLRQTIEIETTVGVSSWRLHCTVHPGNSIVLKNEHMGCNQTGFNAGSSITDITQRVKDFLCVQHPSAAAADEVLINGIASVTSQHTTTAIIVNEYETRLVEDLRLWLNRQAPGADMYLHNDLEVRELPGVMHCQSAYY